MQFEYKQKEDKKEEDYRDKFRQFDKKMEKRGDYYNNNILMPKSRMLQKEINVRDTDLENYNTNKRKTEDLKD